MPAVFLRSKFMRPTIGAEYPQYLYADCRLAVRVDLAASPGRCCPCEVAIVRLLSISGDAQAMASTIGNDMEQA